MRLKIKRKYFNSGNRFQLFDGNDRPLFYAEEELLRMRKNINLFDLNGNLIYRIEFRSGHIFSYFAISKNGAEIGAIDERIHFPFTKRARFTSPEANISICCGPVRLKACLANEKWKADKRSPIATSTKKIADTPNAYFLDFDDKRISVTLAAVIGLWYDIRCNDTQH